MCLTQRTEFFVPPVRSATPLPSLPVCHSPSRWYQWGPLQQRTSETCLSTTRPVVHPTEIRFALFLKILFCLIVVGLGFFMSFYGYFVFFTKVYLLFNILTIIIIDATKGLYIVLQNGFFYMRNVGYDEQWRLTSEV